MPRTATNHSTAQLDLFEIKQAVAVAVSNAFDRKHHDLRRSANPSRTLEQYPAWMRVDQVAAYINCDEKHIRNLIEEGALEAKDISSAGSTKRCLRISRDSVAAYDEAAKAKALKNL